MKSKVNGSILVHLNKKKELCGFNHRRDIKTCISIVIGDDLWQGMKNKVLPVFIEKLLKELVEVTATTKEDVYKAFEKVRVFNGDEEYDTYIMYERFGKIQIGTEMFFHEDFGFIIPDLEIEAS